MGDNKNFTLKKFSKEGTFTSGSELTTSIPPGTKMGKRLVKGKNVILSDPQIQQYSKY